MDIVFICSPSSLLIADNRNDFIETTISWDEADLIDEYIKGIKGGVVTSVILNFDDEKIENRWVVKLLPWERAAMEIRMRNKFKRDGIHHVNFCWQKATQKNENGRIEQDLKLVTVLLSTAVNTFLALFQAYSIVNVAIYSRSYLFEGVYSLYIKRFINVKKMQKDTYTMLVLREGESTFRQVFLKGEQILLTRLTEVSFDSAESRSKVSTALVNDTNATIKYISNQKIMPYNAIVGLIYIGNDPLFQDMVLSKYQEIMFNGRPIEAGQVLLALTFKQLITSDLLGNKGLENVQDVLTQHVFKTSGRTFYETPYLKKVTTLIQAKKSIFFLSMATLFLGLSVIGHLFVDGMILKSSLSELERTKISLLKDEQAAKDSLLIADDAEDVQDLISFTKQFATMKTASKFNFDFESILEVISLNEHIQIIQIEWHRGAVFDSNETSLVLSGLVHPFDGVYLPAVTWLDNFKKALEGLESTETIQFIEEPVNRNPGASLSIGSTELDKNSLPFKLELKVIRDDTK